MTQSYTPGPICLLGSGETLPSSGKTHEFVAQRLPENPIITILETPAGFEPNSAAVAGKIKTFLNRRLQNYKPRIAVLPARKRGTDCSPDNPAVVRPILEADEILLGPGSPTYGARQLRGSLAVEMIHARHMLGATLFLSSSSTLAFSRHTMAVYEIYKVGEDLQWKQGVDYFTPFGIPLSIIPHWDNTDGGEELDTRYCYMGQARFDRLRALLPHDHTILGIDEHTSAVLDFEEGCCHVNGKASITLLRGTESWTFQAGSSFDLSYFGDWKVPEPTALVSADMWQQALDAQAARAQREAAELVPPDSVVALAEQRTAARAARDWATSDALRDEIAALGWQVKDTPDGIELEPA